MPDFILMFRIHFATKIQASVCLFNSTNSALRISQEKKIINMVNNMDSFCPGWYFGLGDLKLIAL